MMHVQDAEAGCGLGSMLADDPTLPNWTDHDRIDLMSRVPLICCRDTHMYKLCMKKHRMLRRTPSLESE